MKKPLVMDGQILGALKQAENGMPVAELYWEHGISSATFYKWRQVRRHGRLSKSPPQSARGRKPSPEEDVRRGASEGGD